MAQLDNNELVNLLAEDRRFRAACSAMRGLLAAGAARSGEVLEDRLEGERVGEWVARESVSYADELLAALDGEVKP